MGTWHQNCREGEGVFIWNDGSIYKGSWKNDKREGFGIKVDAEGRYEGEWKNDQKEG